VASNHIILVAIILTTFVATGIFAQFYPDFQDKLGRPLVGCPGGCERDDYGSTTSTSTTTLPSQGMILLPKPDFNNTFYLLFNSNAAQANNFQTSSKQEWLTESSLLISKIGPQRLYAKVGWAQIMDPGRIDPVEQLEWAHEANVTLNWHFGVNGRSSCNNGFQDEWLGGIQYSDRRNNQWFNDGRTIGNKVEQDKLYGPGATCYQWMTYSRYATEVRAFLEKFARYYGGRSAEAYRKYPENFGGVNGPIELDYYYLFENFRYDSQLHWSDYSPFAIAEFRDWTSHTGMYANNGKYAGQGVELSRIDSNDFSDDPTPSDNGGTGVSFNQYFGTSFTTWKLKYWDLDDYPNKIPVECNVPIDSLNALGYPVGYWNFDEGSGTIASEGCGNIRTGTVYGATWTDGKYGKTLNFDGQNDYVEVNSIAGLPTGTSAFTLSVWINPKSMTDNYIISYGNTVNNGLNSLGLSSTSVCHYFWGNDQCVEVGNITNRWTHVAVTYDSTNIRIYVNGTLVLTQAPSATPNVQSSNLEIGIRLSDKLAAFNGSIDEVRIYDYALSSDHISTLFNTKIVKAMPNSGDGYIEGGFDAPRMQSSGDKLWNLWNNNDVNNKGFIQLMINHLIQDQAKWLNKEGVPMNFIYSHQASIETHPPLHDRYLTAGSPTWTGYIEGGGIGLSVYFDNTIANNAKQLTNDIGLFEIYTQGTDTTNANSLVYKYRIHIVSPDWWEKVKGFPNENIYKDFFNSLPEQPYNNTQIVDYSPPQVTGVSASLSSGKVKINWSNLIWPDEKYEWSVWRDFDHFEIFRDSTSDFIPSSSNRIGTSNTYSYEDLNPASGKPFYKLIAVSKASKYGLPSEYASIPTTTSSSTSTTTDTPSHGLSVTSNFLGTVLSNPNYDYAPTIMKDGTVYKMWWCGTWSGQSGDRILYANSSDGIQWSTPQMVLAPYSGPGWPDATVEGYHNCDPSVVKVNGIYYMYYDSDYKVNSTLRLTRIFLATSSDGISWTKYPSNTNPKVILQPGSNNTSYGIGQPSVIYKDGKFLLYYTDTSRSSSYSTAPVFRASSSNGINFADDQSQPVFPYPAVDVKFISAISKYAILYGDGATKIWISFSDDGVNWNWNNNFQIQTAKNCNHNNGFLGLPDGSMDLETIAYYGAGTGCSDPSTWNIDATNITLIQNSGGFPVGATPLLGFFSGSVDNDLVAFSNGIWYIKYATTNWTTINKQYSWGTSGDIPLIGDVDGDGKSDLIIYRSSSNAWFILKSSQNYDTTKSLTASFGQSGTPLVGDIDGDGKADLSIFNSGTWSVALSSQNYSPNQIATYSWGCGTACSTAGDKPFLADFDGDGKSDLTTWRDDFGFGVLSSIGNYDYKSFSNRVFGVGAATLGDIPLTYDLDYDGKADYVIWRGNYGRWFYYPSTLNYWAGGYQEVWGMSGDIPLIGRFQGKTGVVTFRPASGAFFVHNISFISPNFSPVDNSGKLFVNPPTNYLPGQHATVYYYIKNTGMATRSYAIQIPAAGQLVGIVQIPPNSQWPTQNTGACPDIFHDGIARDCWQFYVPNTPITLMQQINNLNTNNIDSSFTFNVAPTMSCSSGSIPTAQSNADCNSWQTFQNLGGSTPSFSAIQSINNTLIIAVRGNDNKTYVKEWNISNNSLLKDWYVVNNGKTLVAPKLISNSSGVYIYVQGLDGNIYYSIYKTPGIWNAWTNTGICNSNFGTSGPSSIQADDGNVYGVSGNNPIYLDKCNLSTTPIIGTWYTAFYSAYNTSCTSNTCNVSSTSCQLPSCCQLPNCNNHWNNEVALRPVLGNYTSGDINILKIYFKQLKDLGISFIILDDTNGIGNDYGRIEKNIKSIIDYADSLPADQQIKIAVSIGGIDGNTGGTSVITRDSTYIYNNYANHPSYFRWNGKPLLIAYSDYRWVGTWNDSRFTVRWATSPASDGTSKLPSNQGMWGWLFENTTIPAPISKEVIGVVPGWQRIDTAWSVPRDNGNRYMKGWLRAIENNPQVILVTSWDDWSEQTGIADAYDWKDYYGASTPDWYRQITDAYIKFINSDLQTGTYYRDVNRPEVYLFDGSKLIYQNAYPHLKPVILTPNDYLYNNISSTTTSTSSTSSSSTTTSSATTTTTSTTTTTQPPTNCFSTFWNTSISNGSYCCKNIASTNISQLCPGDYPCYLSCPIDALNGWQCVNGNFVDMNPSSDCPYVGATETQSINCMTSQQCPGTLTQQRTCSSGCSFSQWHNTSECLDIPNDNCPTTTTTSSTTITTVPPEEFSANLFENKTISGGYNISIDYTKTFTSDINIYFIVFNNTGGVSNYTYKTANLQSGKIHSEILCINLNPGTYRVAWIAFLSSDTNLTNPIAWSKSNEIKLIRC